MNFFTGFFKLLFYLLVLSAIFAVGGLGVLYHVYNTELPDITALRTVQYQVPMRIYDREGHLIAEFGEKRRFPVRYDELPPVLVKAFLAAEDDRFFEHPGVDVQGLARAGWELLRTGHKGQGGSTITMQVARNFFLSPEKTYTRKLKEVMLAVKIEHGLTKEQILELYLNQIFLGNRAYGVAAAAQIYFNKPLDGLTPAEAAILASLPKAPSRFNPIANPERLKIRRDYILQRMEELGYLGSAEVAQARAEPIVSQLYLGATAEVSAPYVAEMARAQMVARYGDAAYEMGLRVHVSIDGRLQAQAQAAVREGLREYDRRHGYRGPVAVLAPMTVAEAVKALASYPPVGGLEAGIAISVDKQSVHVLRSSGETVTLEWPGLQWARPVREDGSYGPVPKQASDVVALGHVVRIENEEKGWRLAQVPAVEGALTALDVGTGAILALVGGYDFHQGSMFNRAIQAQRQPGSAFKPILYSAALENGFTLATVVNDVPMVIEGGRGNNEDWRPQNYSGKFYGPTRLHEALVRSQNLVSVRVIQSITPQVTIEHARNFGLPVQSWQPTLSMALGSYALTQLELTAAYAVFANGGFYLPPYLVERVESFEGNVLFEASPPTLCDACPPGVLGAHRAISAENAFLMTVMMKDVARRGTAAAAYRALKRPDIAGKTGTTNDQRDAWFMGYTPHLAVGTWVGFDDYQPLGRKETGGSAALPIWVRFMKSALKDQPEADWPTPPGVVTAWIDPETGARVGPDYPGAVVEYFDSARMGQAIDVLPTMEFELGDRQLIEELF